MPHAHPAPAGPAWSEAGRRAVRDQARSTPEWEPWLGLLEIALTAAVQEVWQEIDVCLADVRPVGAPVLDGARITVPGSATDALVAALLRSASRANADAGSVPRAGDPAERLPGDSLTIVSAAIRQDRVALNHIAGVAGVEEGVLAAVAHFASLPLLLEAGRSAAARVPGDWRAGYCPVCAAWPTLVELRGLERRRVLRCGRCAAGWERDVLHCVFCGERDHRQQGTLVPEEGGELVRLETCRSCSGYLKSVTTLRPGPVWALPLEDLRTLELELTALDRGFQRPDQPAWPLDLALSSAPTPAARSPHGRTAPAS
jgi:FdhE protein